LDWNYNRCCGRSDSGRSGDISLVTWTRIVGRMKIVLDWEMEVKCFCPECGTKVYLYPKPSQFDVYVHPGLYYMKLVHIKEVCPLCNKRFEIEVVAG